MLGKILVALATAFTVLAVATPAASMTPPSPSVSVSASVSASLSLSAAPTVSPTATASPTGTTQPTTTATATTTATTTSSPIAVVPADDQLPVTGPSVYAIVGWGLLILALGIIGYTVFRKPRRDFRP